MKRIRITFDIFVPDETTSGEARAYIYYKLNIVNEISMSNIMADMDWSEFEPSVLKIETV